MEKKLDEEFVDVRETTLEEWLNRLFDPPDERRFIHWGFPTNKHREEYIAGISQRSEEEVCSLLDHFLIPTGTLGIDEALLAAFEEYRKSDPAQYERMSKMRFYRRLFCYEAKIDHIPPWEGITWIIDLLPLSPKYALEALNAYILAHIQELPDGRAGGLYDAAELIRAKFIGLPGSQSEIIQFLLSLSPRDFECLVERLYTKMGYDTELTPPQKDGGRDVIAVKNSVGGTEKLLIECKRYGEPIGIEILRALLGVVSHEKVNKGVLITTSQFTSAAKEFADHNPRLELISGEQFVLLMNECCGPKWFLHIERLVLESQQGLFRYSRALS